MKRVLALAFLVAASARCAESEAGATPAPGPDTPGSGILFVGNSLTYTEDLPGLVAALATAAGRPVATASVAYPDYSLEDHWNRGDALRAIARGGWSAVVLQQGPSSLDDSRILLRRDSARFDQRIRAAGARTALFSVWPESARRSAFPAVAESYRLAASDVGGVYLPVTQAWLLAWAQDPSLPLYGPDGFHPSPHGSYLAALVIAAVLTGASPQAMPARVVRPGGAVLAIPEPAASVLRAAARAAIAGQPSSDGRQ
ncbi:MAG: SGNH/GDSL hydrolase family protein [Myxococcales bacterium]